MYCNQNQADCWWKVCWEYKKTHFHRLVRPEHPKQISENVVAFLRFDFRGNKVIDLSPVLSFIFPNPHTAQADYHVFSIPWRFSWVGLGWYINQLLSQSPSSLSYHFICSEIEYSNSRNGATPSFIHVQHLSRKYATPIKNPTNQRFKHRWERLRNYGKKKALHHCGKYCTVDPHRSPHVGWETWLEYSGKIEIQLGFML